MRDIRDSLYHYFPRNKNGIIEIDNIVVNDGDCISLPISFSKRKLNINLSLLKKAIKDKIIDTSNAEEYSIVFNVAKLYEYSYNEWRFLIDFAKNNNINFFINVREEYSAIEMENYIEKFVTLDKDGKKKFLFSYSNYMMKDNDLYDGELINSETYYSDSVVTSIYLNDISEKSLDLYIKEVYEKDNKSIDFILNIREKFDDEKKEKILYAINYLKKAYPGRKFNITFSTYCQYYTKEEFIKLLEVEEYIKRNYMEEYELQFTSANAIMKKEQIITANDKINKIVEYLKKSSLSPYEKIIYLHKLIGEKEYYNNPDNKYISRDIYTILNTRNIVCIGYSMIIKAIINELNDESIKTNIEIVETDEGIYHSINCIYIKDEKYAIEGYYKIDITRNNYCDGLEEFMIPSCDLDQQCVDFSSRDCGPIECNGNLLNMGSFFQKYSSKNYNYYINLATSWDEDIKDINKNTLDFLNTSMGKIALEEAKKEETDDTILTLKAITKCVEMSKSIPVETTKKALEVVANNCYGMNEKDSNKYSSKIVVRTIFNSLFEYERIECENDFARKSLDIESGRLTLVNLNTKKKR